MGIRITRSHSRRKIQLMEFLVALLFVRKQLLNSVQALSRFRAHSVLHKNLGLEHQVLQSAGPERRAPARFYRLCIHFAEAGESGGNDLISLVINFSAKHFQALLVPAFVRIHVSRAIQAFSCFRIIPCIAVHVEEFEQSLAIIALAIGGVEQFTHELQHLRRGMMLRRQVLHRGQKRPAVGSPTLRLFQLACQCNGFSVLFRVQQSSDQIRHFLQPRGVLLEHLPNQRLGFG